MARGFTTFLNCRLCIDGELVHDQLVIDGDSGLILPRTGYIGGDAVDLEDGIIAPGYLELQTNGMLGFHFTHFENEDQYGREIDKVARYLATQGVTGFWVTIPTVADFKKILPSLEPRSIPNGASLLGAHAEGPYLHPSKKGAHDSSLFLSPSTPPSDIYGPSTSLKLVTLAPELPGASSLISSLTASSIRVSLGHTTASHAQGLTALQAGATCLTHTLNAMDPLHHRSPSLASLVASPDPPFYSLIADGQHLHPSIAALLLRAAPKKAILITDSIELAGLPDGVYPGHAQIPGQQRKTGPKVTLEGTETLVGGCASLAECVRNARAWTGGEDIAGAVRCATGNVADMMGLTDRGHLEAGRRADFVVLDDEGVVQQTWIGGRRVWPPEETEE